MSVQNYSNWLTWSFDNQQSSIRSAKESRFKFHFDLSNIDPWYGSYKEELYKNASLMRETFNEKFDVLLSGGIDSEVVVRTFKDLKINHNTFIFKYNDNLNYYDVTSAEEICLSLGIPYKIIDFDVKKFFEHDAYHMFKKTKSLKAARLPQLKFIDLLDNIPVMGNGEPYWKIGDDYNWRFSLAENDHNLSMYCRSLGRDSICDWYEFHPNVLLSFIDHPVIKDILDGTVMGKQSTWSSRRLIHQEIWKDIKDKPKLVGFESDNIPGHYPEYIIEMQKVIDQELGTGQNFWYNKEEFLKLFFSS